MHNICMVLFGGICHGTIGVYYTPLQAYAQDVHTTTTMSIVHDHVVILCPAFIAQMHISLNIHMGGAIHCSIVVVHTTDVLEPNDLCTVKIHAMTHGYIIFAHYPCLHHRKR